jgi:hypothetical protein
VPPSTGSKPAATYSRTMSNLCPRLARPVRSRTTGRMPRIAEGLCREKHHTAGTTASRPRRQVCVTAPGGRRQAKRLRATNRKGAGCAPTPFAMTCRMARSTLSAVSLRWAA